VLSGTGDTAPALRTPSALPGKQKAAMGAESSAKVQNAADTAAAAIHFRSMERLPSV
jgi:hypothetical protein